MTSPMTLDLASEHATFDGLVADLQRQGWCHLPAAVPESLCTGLRCRLLDLEPELQAAGIGRGPGHRLDQRVRQDRIRWLDAGTEVEAQWLQWTERLRVHLNRHLFLGLTGFESHFAHYPATAVYRRHVDAFRGNARRVVSVVLYLNQNWRDTDGGALVLYQADQDGQPLDREIGRFLPESGSLMVFLSQEFPHEVLPAKRERLSVAGWYGGSDRSFMAGLQAH